MVKNFKIIFQLIFFVVVVEFGFAQQFSADTVYITHNNQKVLALVSAFEPNADFVKKETLDFYYSHSKLSFNGKNELVAKEVLIPEISSESLNFYVLIEADNFGSTVYNYAQLGDIYLDTNEYVEEFNSMNLIFNDCLSSVHGSYYKLQNKQIKKNIRRTKKANRELTKQTNILSKKIKKDTKALERIKIKATTSNDFEKLINKQQELEGIIKENGIKKQNNTQKLQISKRKLHELTERLSVVNTILLDLS